MAKIHFIPESGKQTLLFPSRINEEIAMNSPVRIIDQVLDRINMDRILRLYHGKGRNAFYPRMMLKVIVYAYMNNVSSCRIEELLKRDLHFIWLSGYRKPDFITINLFPNPTDTLTYIPFMDSFAARYGRLPGTEVVDSGYGSEENYRYMEERGVEAFVKYNMFHKEQRIHYAPHIIRTASSITQSTTTTSAPWDST